MNEILETLKKEDGYGLVEVGLFLLLVAIAAAIFFGAG